MDVIKKKYILKLFHNFLKKENVLDKFVYNFSKEESIPWRETYEQEASFDLFFQDRMNQKYPSLIRFAFDWTNTKEGFIFWDDLSHKWELFFKIY